MLLFKASGRLIDECCLPAIQPSVVFTRVQMYSFIELLYANFIYPTPSQLIRLNDSSVFLLQTVFLFTSSSQPCVLRWKP